MAKTQHGHPLHGRQQGIFFLPQASRGRSLHHQPAEKDHGQPLPGRRGRRCGALLSDQQHQVDPALPGTRSPGRFHHHRRGNRIAVSGDAKQPSRINHPCHFILAR